LPNVILASLSGLLSGTGACAGKGCKISKANASNENPKTIAAINANGHIRFNIAYLLLLCVGDTLKNISGYNFTPQRAQRFSQ
jgi:hypothetical protein